MDVLNNRNFRFTVGRTWDGSGNNVIRNVMDGINFVSEMPHPRNLPLNQRMNNSQRFAWHVRDSRNYRSMSHWGDVRRTIRRFRNKIHQALDWLEDARVDLQEAREGVDDAKTEVIWSSHALKNVVDEADRVTNNLNLQTSISNIFNDFERNELRRDIHSLRGELEDAKRHMRYAEDECNEDDREANAASLPRRRNVDGNNVPESRVTSPQPENNNNNPHNDLCSICMEKPINSVLYKCGHMCMCYQCAFKLHRRRNSRGQCPMCRAVIRDIIKTYKS